MQSSYVREIEMVYKKNGTSRNGVPLHKVTDPQDVHVAFSFIAQYPKEVFLTLLLDSTGGVLGYETVSIGSEICAPVVASCAFRGAVHLGAARVIFIHNHPGGSLIPSDEDQRTTGVLVEAGKLLGIEVMDHVVIGQKGYYSFKEHGALPSASSSEQHRSGAGGSHA